MAPNQQGTPAAPAIPKTLIDMHCHVFNATDLPATPFIYRVVAQRYSADPDAIAAGIGMLLSLLGGNAATPGEELDDIRHNRRSKDAAAHVAAAGGAGTGAGIFNWLKLFGHPRRDLVARLARFYTDTDHRCELIAPALVDYNAWLDNPDAEGRRLDDQVAVMGAIAKLPGKPRVHGFVGFDPIRAILAPYGYYPGGTAMPIIDPHALVRDAVENHGFLGVKLYPPMGFRAWNNGKGDLTFSPMAKKYVGQVYDGIGDRQLGELIDAELAKLYRYCADQGVPILAHAYNSNQADQCTGWRASPQYWGEVIDRFSTPEKPLRLCLGHFGSFSAHTKFPGCADAFTAKAWEVIIGSILAKPGAQFVYADLSYLAEVLDRSDGWQARRATMRDRFKSFLSKYDAAAEHICYGSDWIMLGLEPGHERYHLELGDFLRNDVQLNAAQLANVYFNNAVAFLGLRPGDQARARLEKFYRDNTIEPLFPQLDAMV